MRSYLRIWILFLIIATAVPCELCIAQVYAVGPSGGPMTQLREDEIRLGWGSETNGFGILEFRSRLGQGAPWKRYATVHLGSWRRTIEITLERIVAIAAIAVVIIVIILLGFAYAFRKPRSYRMNSTQRPSTAPAAVNGGPRLNN